MIWGYGDFEQNLLGTVVRTELENGLVPGLLSVRGLLLKADGETHGQLLGWLGRVSSVMLAESEFLAEMGRDWTLLGVRWWMRARPHSPGSR